MDRSAPRPRRDDPRRPFSFTLSLALSALLVAACPAVVRAASEAPDANASQDDQTPGQEAGRSERDAAGDEAGTRADDTEAPDETGSRPAATFDEKVQVTATRTERTPQEVPAPVSVIGREEIQELQAGKPGDLLPFQAGLEVDGSGPFLGLPVVRGMAGNRVLVLVDGHRLNNSREAINFGGVQPSLVDVGEIEEIQVTRGPASVLYGTDAIGGIVNLVTRRPPIPQDGLAFGGRVSPRYGSAADQQSVSADLHAATPRGHLLLQGSSRDYEDYESPEGPVPNSGAETESLHAEVGLRPAEDHSLELDYQRFRGEDVGIPGTGGVFTGSFPATDRDMLSARYEGRLPGARATRVRANASFQEQVEAFATVLDLPPFPSGPFLLSIDTETVRESDVETAAFDLEAQTALGAQHLLTYGVGYFRDSVREARRETSVLTFTPLGPGPPPFTRTEEDTAPTTPEGTFEGLGVFVQDEIRWDRLTLVPGVRFDRFEIETDDLVRPEGVQPGEDRTEEAVSASVGALYRMNDAWSLAASAGRAFRTPNLIERYFFGPGSQGGLTVPNPDLENETSLNVDLGFKLDGRRVRGSITYFRNEIDDFITFVPGTFQGQPTFGGQPVTTVDNIGEARVQGVEADAEAVARVAGSRWRLFGAATYNRAEDLSGDEPLFVAPLKVAAGLTWHAPGGLVSASLLGRAVEGQDRVPESFEPTAGFAVFHLYTSLALDRWLGGDATLRLGVENLGDRAYEEPYGAVLEPGRSYVATLDLGFGTGRGSGTDR